MKKDLAGAAQAPEGLDTVLRYHEQTKHHFFRYAQGPDSLDWANQPDPFRRYEGAPVVALPRLRAGDAPASPPYEDLYRAGGGVAGTALSAASLSRFLECSLAISAWKQAGNLRWALRINPSSGNLHPTEAYLLIDQVDGLLPAPGLYHYAPREHALELRAQWPRDSLKALLQVFPPGAFLLGLASVHWREAWKYGERAFRYCQHDVGHALGSARFAARMLGWRMLLLDGQDDDTVASMLGIDRPEDFEGAEREHPDGLAVLWPDAGVGLVAPEAVSLPLCLDSGVTRDAPPRVWHGKANRLSPDEPVRWAGIEEVEAACSKSQQACSVVELRQDAGTGQAAADTGTGPGLPSAAQVIRQRRSATAFDGTTAMPVDGFFAMLARTLPRVERNLGRRPAPWDAVPWAPAIDLALFVHRVDGLTPGLYMLARDPAHMEPLRRATYKEYAWSVPTGCADDLPLFLLQQADVRELAAQLCCGQRIAADGAFSLGMIAHFEAGLRRQGPWFYRRLFWETGLIGQVLYLEAEAVGLRATGIGCFFDDPVHQVLGFQGAAFQSLYHFAIGAPVDDPRLTTLPPYGLENEGESRA
ncbi:SagB/ThcOx family dehydrogenase [Azohydromonas australica]|uniref:SagB/ThcOx family dehydrogenase n=1 Tax=Azohydromonas australica TaxID=364039 RepID=UPI00041207CD|nr:SagB/ThcOx family dehydrogenase [Azohydromonas australica]